MKKLFLISLLGLMVGCKNHSTISSNCDGGSCQAKLPVQDHIAMENWGFDLVGSNWQPGTIPLGSSIQVFFEQKPEENVVFFVKEPTTSNLPDYVENALNAFQLADATVSSVKTAKIDSGDGVVLTVKHDPYTMKVWVVIKQNYAYSLACASADVDGGADQACQQMVSSLFIN